MRLPGNRGACNHPPQHPSHRRCAARKRWRAFDATRRLLPLKGHVMLTHPTLDNLKALRLDGMAEAFCELQSQDGATEKNHAEWLGLLVDREVASRETKRFEARMRSARLRHVGACPEDVDYRARRGLDKALFQSLLTGKWITDRRNLIIRCLAGDVLHRREEPAPVGSERPGSAAPWRKRPAATASPWSTSGCSASLRSLNWPMAPLGRPLAQSPAGQWMAASPACSAASPKLSCLSSPLVDCICNQLPGNG